MACECGTGVTTERVVRHCKGGGGRGWCFTDAKTQVTKIRNIHSRTYLPYISFLYKSACKKQSTIERRRQFRTEHFIIVHLSHSNMSRKLTITNQHVGLFMSRDIKCHVIFSLNRQHTS